MVGRMNWMRTAWLLLMGVASALASEPALRPGRLTGAELKEYATLEGTRKHVIDEALALASRDAWLRYRFGSAEPESGGLDCSGAVYFILHRVGLRPPRSSIAQFRWVEEAGALHNVPAKASSMDTAAFAALRPGDLLFWSGTYQTKERSEPPVSHVQIFLGHEKSSGAPVMIGASDGRTYRGIKREGYGVFDFKLPKLQSKAKFLGYGLPDATLMRPSRRAISEK